MPYFTPSTPVIGRSLPIVPNSPPPLACLSCGDGMELVRTIPRLGVLPELLVFHCPSCKEVDAKELMNTRHKTASNVPNHSIFQNL